MAASWLCPDKSKVMALYVLLFYYILRYLKRSIVDRPWARAGFETVDRINFARLTSTYVAMRLGKSVVSAMLTIMMATTTSSSSKLEPTVAYIAVTAIYFCLSDVSMAQNKKEDHFIIRCVQSAHLDVLEELEFLWVPFIVQAFVVATSVTFAALTLYMHTEWSLLITALYSNIYEPYQKLCTEYWRPLSTELSSLHVYRQPDKDELDSRSDAGQCPICLENMRICRITPCGHIFHSHCLRKSLQSGFGKCPICRHQLIVHQGLWSTRSMQ